MKLQLKVLFATQTKTNDSRNFNDWFNSVMWATGTGSDVMKPLTAPLIGGLLTSAVHVLVVTPILFAIMKERALRKGTLELSKMSDWMKEG
jgi:hypothetical protein